MMGWRRVSLATSVTLAVIAGPEHSESRRTNCAPAKRPLAITAATRRRSPADYRQRYAGAVQFADSGNGPALFRPADPFPKVPGGSRSIAPATCKIPARSSPQPNGDLSSWKAIPARSR